MIRKIKCQLAVLEEDCQLALIVELCSELQPLRVKYEEMQCKIEDNIIETQVHSQLYNDNVSQCCLDVS